jgi:hypothetical protein
MSAGGLQSPRSRAPAQERTWQTAELDRAGQSRFERRANGNDANVRATRPPPFHALAKRIVHGEKRVEELLERAKEYDQKQADSQAELAKVEKTIIDLNRQSDRVRELMLVP